MKKIKLLIIGAIGGITSGLTGIGGGTVMVPLLTSITKMQQHRAHANSLVIVIFGATAALILYIERGDIEWNTAIILGLGGIIGGQVGAKIMHGTPDNRLKIIFSIFLIIVGFKLLLGN
ncbi:MAG: sulfite exporter TauE/SafE family protein [Dehalococcoidia bacterium]|jgi:hypothetical protein|nr:sulfite exporter TauE/SafE family protein [Dehalococcoidia bacterium]|tara:strand:- start:400 stop:756 length:357 start_codon:yes stop_codon:yes gene_type:complete